MRSVSVPVALRARGFDPRARPWVGAATLAGLLLLWQAAASAGLVSTSFASAPLPIVAALARLAASGELWANVSVSLQRLGLGWIAGTCAGVAAGLAAGLFTAARSPGMAVVSALFPVPKIALVPLFIVWFGIGEGSKIVTVAIGVFFPTVIGVLGGVDGVPRGLIRMAQSFGVPTGAIVRKIVLPGALPAILSTFRITTGTAVILLVAAEMIGAQHGIGAFVLSAGNLYDTDDLLAGIVVLSLMGLAVSALLGLAERRLLRWRKAAESAE